MTNNDLQHFTQKRLCNTKPTKNWGDFGAPGELEIPAPLVTSVVLLLNDTNIIIYLPVYMITETNKFLMFYKNWL
jgi:hypothetical protein